MRLLLIILACAILLMWVIGLVLGWTWLLLTIASGAVLGLVGLGVGGWYAWRWHSGAAAADGTAGAKAAIQALRVRWQAELPALRTVHGGGRALIEQPWYLVVGPTGSGKTRLLRDSGLAFIANEAAAGTGDPTPTASFTWWCTGEAAYLDTAGRLLSEPRSQGEWRVLLQLIRRHRAGAALNGIIFCLDLGQVITQGKSALGEAATWRERLAEASAELGLVLPLYVVFTKSDHLGGFKDFASALRRSDQEQVLGATLPWPLTGQPAETWSEAHRGLAQALRNRRLAAFAQAANDEVARKQFQFPLQFQASARFVEDWLTALCPASLSQTPLLRGVYFTSCALAPKPAAAPAPVAMAAPEHSVFLAASTSQAVTATAVREAVTPRPGCFVRSLFSRILPLDHDLARPTTAAHRGARQARWLCLGAAPAAAGAALLAIGISGWRQTSLLAEARLPAEQVREVEHNAPTDAPRNLEALDRLGDRLTSLLAADHGRLGPGIDGLAALYVARLKDLLLQPCLEIVTVDLARLRTAPGTTVGKGAEQDALYDLFRSYQMLAGAIPADSALLSRTLLDQRRWFTGIDRLSPPPAKVDYYTEQLAKRQLEFLPRLLATGRGRIEADRRLVDAITKDLGEALWLRRGYDDLIRSVSGQFPAARAELLGTDAATLVTTHEFTLVYSQRGWDDAIRRGIEEKATALAHTFTELDIALPRAEIARRLTELYFEDHRRQWLTLLATAQAAPSKDIRDVPVLIDRLSGKSSPYPAFARAAVAQLNLRTGSALGQLFTTGEDFAWIEPGLRALGELRKDVETFVATTEPLHRARDAAPVKALAERFTAIGTRLNEVVAGVQPEDKREALRRGFSALLVSLWAPLDRELAEEFDARWGAQIAARWADTCAGRFPFTPTAAAEVPLDVFAKFMNPVSGTFWTIIAPCEQIRSLNVAGHPAVTFALDYAATLAKATELRNRCFAGGSETVNAPLTITLVQREGVEDLSFSLGNQTVSYYQRPDARYTLALKQGEPATVKIAVRILKGQWRTVREMTQQPWGVLRLFRSGEPTLLETGGYRLTWPLETTINGKPASFKSGLVVEAAGFERAAFGDVLSTFTIPRRILPSSTP